MRIKKLEVFGFKSFADRVVIHFDQGVTGIVGPNGCGKSNVVDALRWVMGEQNAKHLRGDAMQDIIFAGAQGRSSMGLAEVILTFENDGTLIPSEYAHFSEIEVARRLYKNGDSEYEINKRPCRLRDITELFLGTGIGTKAYSIIEQGRVASIIAAKPEERRLIIEEAAGITKYKARRQAAERKMESTEQNLMRITDVQKEVEGRLGVLERQAKKAAKYHSIMEEIRDVDFHHAALQFFHHKGALNFLENSKGGLDQQIAQKREELSAHENLLVDERNRLFEEEKKLGLTKGMLFEADNAASLAKQEILHNDQTLLSKQKQDLQIHDEMRRQEDRRDRLSKEQKTQSGEQEGIKNEFEAAEQIGHERGEELRAMSEIRAGKMRNFQEAQNRFFSAAQAATKAQSALQNIETQRSMFSEKVAQLEKEKLSTSQQLEALAQRETVLKAELESSKNRKFDLDSSLEVKSQELRNLDSDAATFEKTRVELQSRHALSSSRLTSLEEIEKSFEWSSSGIAQVMKSANSDAILGLVADFIEVPAELEDVVELALKDKLETVLVKSPEHALSIIATLSQKKEGRLRFHIVGDSQTPSQKSPVGTLLSELVKPVGAHGKFVQQLLSHTAVIDETSDALAHRGGSWDFISKSGDMLSQDGAICGGVASKSSGVLGRKREIRELAVQLTQIEKEQSALSEKILLVKSRRDELMQEVHELRQMAQNLAISLARFEENMRSRENEFTRLSERELQLSNERAGLETKDQSLQLEAAELQKAWAASLETHHEQEELVRVEQEALRAMEANVSQKSEEVTILREQIATKRERLTSLRRSLAQIEIDLGECESTLTKLAEQQKMLKGEQSELAERNEIVAKKFEQADKERNHLATVLAAQQADYERDLQVLKDKDNALSGLRAELEHHQSAMSEILVSFERHQMALSSLSDRLHEKHRTRPEEVLHEYHHLPAPEWEYDKKSTELRRSIESLGAINPTAVEEFEELNARFQFLKMQSDDLKVALSQLESAINKINLMTRQRFEESYHAINERFSQVFPRLFRGGKAWLELTDPDDLLTSGVEIFAQPPGKKLGSIALMSGGEKALTAISLIFAIFLIKPSPFCLLDEVDAPLDEANVERFSQIVKEMSKVSQFIVITHNKRTMEVADQLYGVTMESAGVSKTVNVRISEQLGLVTPSADTKPKAEAQAPEAPAQGQLELA